MPSKRRRRRPWPLLKQGYDGSDNGDVYGSLATYEYETRPSCSAMILWRPPLMGQAKP